MRGEKLRLQGERISLGTSYMPGDSLIYRNISVFVWKILGSPVKIILLKVRYPLKVLYYYFYPLIVHSRANFVLLNSSRTQLLPVNCILLFANMTYRQIFGWAFNRTNLCIDRGRGIYLDGHLIG